MKLIIYTTCKPFRDNDLWRQEQAIKSWIQLEGIEKKIIICGDDYGTDEICKKYDLIHRPDIRKLDGVPYLHDMFEIANEYADTSDYLLWINSDMICFNDMIQNILSFDKLRQMNKNNNSFKDFILIGRRWNWENPKKLDSINKKHFMNKMVTNLNKSVLIKQYSDDKYYGNLHPQTGIDYVIHSKTTFINKISKELVIAGTGHDMIMVGTALRNNNFCCNISNTNFIIHQNHNIREERHGLTDSNFDYSNIISNNRKIQYQDWDLLKGISDVKNITCIESDEIKFKSVLE